MSVSCEEQEVLNDPFSNPLDQEPLWESERLSKTESFLILPHSLSDIPTNDGTTMVGMIDEDGKVRYAGLDIETGRKKWVSDYYTEKNSQLVGQNGGATVDGVFYFTGQENEYEEGGDGSPVSADYPVIGLNIGNGKLEYRRSFEPYYLKNVRQKGGFIVSNSSGGTGNGYFQPTFWVSKLPNLNWTELKTPYVNDFTYGKNKSFVSDWQLVEENDSVFLVYLSDEPLVNGLSSPGTGKDGEVLFHINCYNLTSDEWVYQHKEIEGGFGMMPIDGKYVYTAVSILFGKKREGLRALKWRTGEQVWHMDGEDFGTSRQITLGVMAKDGNTIINNSVGFMYGIDAINGTLKWEKPGIGNATSRIVFHNGVAYSTSLGGFLYGIDVETGEQLLKASCPSEGRVEQGIRLDGFTWSIGKYVRDDGSAVLICQNYMYAYAFEAVR